MYDNSKDVSKWFADGGDEKFRYDYPLGQLSVVVDLGGYQGHFADKLCKKFGCTVHVFEPIKDYYLQCCKTNKTNPKVKVYPFGISGDYEGPIDISIDADASSIFKANEAKQKTEIFIKPTSYLFAEDRMALQHIHLLKINVEGAEYDILDALINHGWIKRVTTIQVQFHTFVPDAEAKREVLHKKLAETHELKWNYPFVWESWTIKS